MKNNVSNCLFFLLLISCCSCRKFVTVAPPTTELVSTSVYGSNATAASAVTGIYLTMAGNSVGGGANGISALAGLSADELNLYPGANSVLNEVFLNAQSSTTAPGIWSDLYNLIFQANSAIEGVAASSGVTSEMKAQLTGESEFVRAFCYFYLVNLYGDVPLLLTTDYHANGVAAKTPANKVYQQIVADLVNAQGLLGNNYLTPAGAVTSERFRPNSATAAALLSRVYLYGGVYDSAEAAATSVIGNATYGLVSDLDSAFLAGNTEAIWQLEIPDNGFNAPDGGAFLLGFLYFGGPSGSLAPFTLSNALIAAFPAGDLRMAHWVVSDTVTGTAYFYPFKYKLYYTGQPATEYPTLFRLAEQYLIRAEARTNEGKITGPGGSLEDLNMVRVRAGIGNYAGATDQASVLSEIQLERRLELFTEYGHRWMDLKRTGQVDAVMSVVTGQKGGSWTSNDSLYVIPLADIQADDKLVQNQGYN